jgi:multiple sugar transport system substrate-binding protein
VAELAACSKLIADKLKGEGIYGFALNLKSPRSAIDRSFEFMAQRSGGPRWGFDFRKGEYDFTFHRPIVEEFRKIFSGGSAFPGCVSLDIDPLRTQFAAGKIGMYISWSHAEPGVYANQFPTKERWGVAPLPTIERNAKSKHKKEAWIVISELMASKDYIVGYHEAGLGTTIVPEYIAAAGPSPTIKAHPALALDSKDKIWPATPLDISAAAMVVEGKDYWNTVVELFFSDADIGKALAGLTKRYNAAYRKGIASGKLKEIKYPRFDPSDPVKSIR